MSGRVFLPGNLKGRLGNQLFAVHMALQISKFFEVPVSLPFRTNLKLFRLQGLRLFKFDSLISRKGLRIESRDFLSNDISVLLSMMQQSLLNNADIIIPTSLLGEGFFRFGFLPPKDLIQLRHKSVSNQFSESVALHYRGTDFAKWNPSAIMTDSFYLNSIDFLGLKDLNINIFSDDPESTTVQRLLKILPNSKLYPEASLGETFAALSQHRYVIASPSTFSFWAALLGISSTFVISRNWIDTMNSRGDDFWPEVARNKNNYFDSVFTI